MEFRYNTKRPSKYAFAEWCLCGSSRGYGAALPQGALVLPIGTLIAGARQDTIQPGMIR